MLMPFDHGPFLGLDPTKSDFESAIGNVVAGRSRGSTGSAASRDAADAARAPQDARKEFRSRSRRRWPSGLNARISPAKNPRQSRGLSILICGWLARQSASPVAAAQTAQFVQ